MPIKDREQRLAYQRKYQGRWIARRRAAWLEGKRCEVCGSAEQLNIVTRGKRYTGGAIWTATTERRQKLLKGAVVLCLSHTQQQRALRRRDFKGVRTELQRHHPRVYRYSGAVKVDDVRYVIFDRDGNRVERGDPSAHLWMEVAIYTDGSAIARPSGGWHLNSDAPILRSHRPARIGDRYPGGEHGVGGEADKVA